MNLTLLLDMAADTVGDRIAVGSRRGGLSYAVLRERSRSVAAGLTAAGLDRLVLAAENTQEIPALVFGSAYAGATFTAVNYRLADDRLREALARCAPAALVTDERTAPRVSGINGLVPLALGTPGADLQPDDAEAVAIALFTSGTSGAPKTVLLRHRNLTSYVVSTTEFLAADEDEAALISVPPYHIAGMASVLSNVYLGRRMVYLPAFDPQAWVDLAHDEEVTHAMIVPTMLGRILDVLEQNGTKLPHLRHLSYGGGRMPLPTIRRALALLPEVNFVNAYGLTETSSTIALLGPEDHRAAATSEDPDVSTRLASVGRPLPGVELEIRDADGRRLPASQTGEIVVRGDQVAGEYDGRDAKDAEGWFHTNDRGYLDPGGYLFIEGRADDVIVRGGENLSPGEIEDVLLQHDSIAEVAVVGMPSEEWGEAVAAFVVPVEGAMIDVDEIRLFVRTHLRSSRAPEVVHVRAALPYSETGKLLRRELRAELRG